MIFKRSLLVLRFPSIREERLRAWSLFLLAATVRSFAHMPLGISDRNKMVLWPGCEGRAEFSLHIKNVRSVWFVVNRRGCCCNLSGGVAFIVWFTTNGMCGKNNTIICVARASNSKRDCKHDLYCCLLPRCEALCTCRSGFPIATSVKPSTTGFTIISHVFFWVIAKSLVKPLHLRQIYCT